MHDGAAGSPFVVADEISRITVKCGNGPLPAMTSAPAQVSFGGGAEGTACARFHTSTQLKRQSRPLRLLGRRRRMACLFINNISRPDAQAVPNKCRGCGSRRATPEGATLALTMLLHPHNQKRRESDAWIALAASRDKLAVRGT